MPLQIGKTPIVVPRQHQFNEHVNDHQVEFARNVAQRMGTIIPVEDINTLGDIITNYDQIVAGIGQKRFINRFAEASFTVYLLHNKFLKFLRIPQFVLKMPIIMLLHILISVLLIYTVCVVIYYAYSKSIPPILNSLYNKFPVFKKGILENEWR